MTKIKFCGMMRVADILTANELEPDYIGFVFYPHSSRFISEDKARRLKSRMSSAIKAVGVFVNEDFNNVKSLLDEGVIDIAQLHGTEDEEYISKLRLQTGKPVIKAFKIRTEQDVREVNECPSDLVLLDSGQGSGKVFDWTLLKNVERPYFLAGGLSPLNVADAVRTIRPFAVDVSSGIETGSRKDKNKMALFIEAVRKEDAI